MRVVLKSVVEDSEDVERIGHPMIVAGRRAVSHCLAGVPGSHTREPATAIREWQARVC